MKELEGTARSRTTNFLRLGVVGGVVGGGDILLLVDSFSLSVNMDTPCKLWISGSLTGGGKEAAAATERGTGGGGGGMRGRGGSCVAAGCWRSEGSACCTGGYFKFLARELYGRVKEKGNWCHFLPAIAATKNK